MDFSEKMYGFVVTDKVSVLNAQAVLMEHEKTGARLIFMNNGDENKHFSIAFKTLPFDDSGVFHILEHSVLCGSEKYPVKEPFLDLLKSSMNTFLNAMTFPDKTVYPVSSRNKTDFLNLTKVYLDAVFSPSIYNNPHIFEQEGWHIETGGEPSYNGVVFNEMKGALSSVHSKVDGEICSLLFPSSCYRFESGGDPKAIPSLTYDKFLETHARFYHPSNAYVYLDGDINICEVLPLLDEYFVRYEKRENDFELAEQPPVAPCESTAFYEIAPDEEIENKCCLAFGKIIGRFDETEKILACHILSKFLAGTNESPLSRALLDTGLCTDVDVDVNDGIFQPYGILSVENISVGSVEKIKETVRKTVQRIISEGIDPEDINACINRIEFELREGEEPQGLNRNIYVLASWLYCGDPFLYIELDDAFAFLRKMVKTGYFESLLKEMFLEENGRAQTLIKPSYTYGQELANEEAERVKAALCAMSEEEKKALCEENEKLKLWQEAPDSEEAAATLPKLPLSEVGETPVLYPYDVYNERGVKIIHRKPKNSGIDCLNLYFSVADFDEDEIFLSEFLSNLLMALKTENLEASVLQRKGRAIFGDISMGVEAYGNPEAPDYSKPYFAVKVRMLKEKFGQSLSLLSEILLRTVFEDGNKIKETLAQIVEKLRRTVMANGHLYALMRSRSGLSSESSVRELVNGWESYNRYVKIKESFDESPQLADKLSELCKKIFTLSRLTVSLTSGKREDFNAFFDSLPHGDKPKSEEFGLKLNTSKTETFTIPSSVAYCSSSLKTRQKDTAVWKVLSGILSLQYLWNEIRVKGGAYGAGANLNSLGEFGYYTYRDPSPKASLEVFASCDSFLSDYCKALPDIDSYIISTIAKEESLKTDGETAAYADALYFRGISDEMRTNDRKRMLSLKCEDLQKCIEELKNIGCSSVIANEETVNSLK